MEATDPKVEVRHRNVGYERRDLDHNLVIAFLVVLGCAGILVHLALWGMFRTLGADQYAGHQTTNPIMTSNEELRGVGGDPAVTFPMPRLQPNPQADLNKFRIREEQQLNSYGWVNQGAGKIHIPIERAIDIMATSWPQNGQTAAAATTGEQSPKQAKQPEKHE